MRFIYVTIFIGLVTVSCAKNPNKIKSSTPYEVGVTACTAMETPQILQVAPESLKSRRGTLFCALFDTDSGFPTDPEKAFQRDARNLEQGEAACCTFENLPPGSYAISLLHDEDGNQEMTSNLFGAPTEGYGTSNNAPPRGLSPPSYKDAVFSYDGTAKQMTIPIRY